MTLDKILLAAVSSGLISGLIAAVLGYLAISRKIEKEKEATVDLHLRKLRIEAYRELWKVMLPLSISQREKDNPILNAKELSEALAKWYFETGGIYLSDVSQSAYRILQHTLQKVIDCNAESDHYSELVGQAIQDASDLRTCTARDIGSREQWSSRYGDKVVRMVLEKIKPIDEEPGGPQPM